MGLALGIAGSVLGYTLVYYGVNLWRSYDSSTGGARAIPLSVLLGLPANQYNPSSTPFYYGPK